METKISTDYSGMTSEAVNVELHNGVIQPIKPKRNAIIIDYIERETDDGEMAYETVITIECKDEIFYERMKVKALSIARTI